MTKYYRIRSDPEELEMSHEKKIKKCFDENKIFVGHPKTLGIFKGEDGEGIKKGDYFITCNKDGKDSYIGEITSDCKNVSEDLHYRTVKWLNDKKSVGVDRFFKGVRHTCTEIDPDDVTDFKSLIKPLLDQ